uniref:Putative ovule protein n=1 Tax=Solanum chacoense TaxID=4108 RepID=A0A0V0HBZ6_SOLCH
MYSKCIPTIFGLSETYISFQPCNYAFIPCISTFLSSELKGLTRIEVFEPPRLEKNMKGETQREGMQSVMPRFMY